MEHEAAVSAGTGSLKNSGMPCGKPKIKIYRHRGFKFICVFIYFFGKSFLKKIKSTKKLAKSVFHMF